MELFDLPNLTVLNDVNLEQSEVFSSDCSYYVPIYALRNHTYLEIDIEEDEKVKLIEYNKLRYGSTRAIATRGYSVFFQAIKSSTGALPVKFSFRFSDATYSVYAFRGIVWDSSGVLFCVGMDSEYLFSDYLPNIVANPDNSRFVMLVHNRFETDEIYNNLYKRFKKEIIDPTRASNVDTFFVSNIDRFLYRSNYQLPQFTDFEELDAHLKEVPNYLLP